MPFSKKAYFYKTKGGLAWKTNRLFNKNKNYTNMGKSKRFCPKAKPRPNMFSKSLQQKFLKLTAMALTLKRAGSSFRNDILFLRV